MRKHWIMTILFVISLFCIDRFVVDPIVKASKTMQEVQTVIEPEPDVYTHLDFFIDKIAEIERILHNKGLVTYEDSQRLQEIDYKWFNQQCYEIMKEIEEERKEE